MHSGCESSDNYWPTDSRARESRLQSSTYPSSRVKRKSKTWSLKNPKLGVKQIPKLAKMGLHV
jgi:hypothetical protein